MMAGLAFLLQCMGFWMMAASMSRHRQPLGTAQLLPAQLQRWRMAGYVVLAVSLWPCLMEWRISVALAVWGGLLTLAGLVLGLGLTYAPGVLRRLNVLMYVSRSGRIRR